jgi:hypothetical protein
VGLKKLLHFTGQKFELHRGRAPQLVSLHAPLFEIEHCSRSNTVREWAGPIYRAFLLVSAGLI